MSKVRILILLFIFTIQSCEYSYDKNIGQGYYINSIGSPVSMTICFGNDEGCEGILPNTVYEVFWNENFILAGVHPSDGIHQGSIQKSRNDYFLINKAVPARHPYRKLGPYTEGQRDSIVKVYKIDLSKMESQIFEDLK